MKFHSQEPWICLSFSMCVKVYCICWVVIDLPINHYLTVRQKILLCIVTLQFWHKYYWNILMTKYSMLHILTNMQYNRFKVLVIESSKPQCLWTVCLWNWKGGNFTPLLLPLLLEGEKPSPFPSGRIHVTYWCSPIRWCKIKTLHIVLVMFCLHEYHQCTVHE